MGKQISCEELLGEEFTEEFVQFCEGQPYKRTDLDFDSKVELHRIVLWLESKGIYLDRNVPDAEIIVWDYREGEPDYDHPPTVDCRYEEWDYWYYEAIKFVISDIL